MFVFFVKHKNEDLNFSIFFIKWKIYICVNFVCVCKYVNETCIVLWMIMLVEIL